MEQAYEISRMVNGEVEKEIVTLRSQNDCDLNRALYQAAVELCLTPKGKELCGNGLAFEQLLDHAEPILLEKHGITVYRPGASAIKVPQNALLLSRSEIETYQAVCKNHQQELDQLRESYQQQFDQMSEKYQEERNRLRDISYRYTRKLYTLGKRGHSTVSTWDPSLVPVKGLEWAFKAMKQGIYRGPALNEFFDQKVQEMKSGKYTGEEWGHISLVEAIDDPDGNQ